METLKKVLAQPDTILFIGSGISMWSGLPTWAALIDDLAKFVESLGANADVIRDEAKRGDLLQAASYGFDRLTKHQIGDFIRIACRYGTATPHEIHRKIVLLGPRCFVTTNYDNLIEESLRRWQPDRFFRPPVTNRHLTETAEIVHARAIDFIFKPHGDVGDNDSIILTREQYRQLLPQGERHNALESLKMLLASRPIIYLGFSLRDPDFIYVRDLLANTYKGGIRDHYAVMPDVTDTECEFWRRNYGIHLVGYATTERLDGSRNHAPLLAMLDKFLEAPESPLISGSEQTESLPCAPDVVLSLARHAARLTRSPKSEFELQIRVHAEGRDRARRRFDYDVDPFNNALVDKFLDDGPARAVLVGLPGAGKTYALQQAAARLAEKLHEACLAEAFNQDETTVPLLADMKLYRGNLIELVSQTLPKSIPFAQLARRFRLKVFLDSFNEMPREYWESGAYESDFATFMTTVESVSLIIGSRTTDGLLKLGFPAYHLDEIDEADVVNALQRLSAQVAGRFETEVRSLLRKPFYFQLLVNGKVKLPQEAHPRDFYQSLFAGISDSFVKRFGKSLDLEPALSRTAYDAINRGEEAYQLSSLIASMKLSLLDAQLKDLEAHDIANWLISISVLVPYTGGRIAFVHQSVTEYLASSELARRYESAPHILKEKLSLPRWDQALFLALSLLPASKADGFLRDVITSDFTLALRASKYLEHGRNEVVSKLLAAVPLQLEVDSNIKHELARAIESGVSISDVHEPALRALMTSRDVLGAAAVKRLVELKGEAVKQELLQDLLDAPCDHNYSYNGIASALAPFAIASDIPRILAMADSIEKRVRPVRNEEKGEDFASAAARFLGDLDIDIVRDGFFSKDPQGDLSALQSDILCSILMNHHSTAALELAGELLLRGSTRAGHAIYFISMHKYPNQDLSWDAFGESHIDALEPLVRTGGEHGASAALRAVCDARPDLAELVNTRISGETGLASAALASCALGDSADKIFEALAELCTMSDEQRRAEPVDLLRDMEIDWTDQEELVVRLLRLRDVQLACAILGGGVPIVKASLGTLEIGPIEWWLEWMEETSGSQTGWWFAEQLGSLFGAHLQEATQDLFVAEFNRTGSGFRQVLMRHVLTYFKRITSDAFSEDAISFMMADLNRESGQVQIWGHLLGDAATESFVAERLLPLLPGATPPFLGNLRAVLAHAGRRHGRRYNVLT